MIEYISDVTTMSSKGQIVLPKVIRDNLKIDPGSKLLVISDGDSIILKPIQAPNISEFRNLMDAASSWAKKVDMAEEDIIEAIKTVRSRKRQENDPSGFDTE